MSLGHRVVKATLKHVPHLLCRVHDRDLDKVPMKGPLILVSNHINFLEIPILYTHLQPRSVITLAKVETWDNPLLGYLFDMGGAIPLRRGEADVVAIRRALAALAAGGILAIAPEGTRSNHGRLQRGNPGVGLLALRSGAPLMPLVFHGNEALQRNLVRLRRTDFHIAVGQPFHIESQGTRVKGRVRQDIVDEIMYQLAALLPPANRGEYADLESATERYLRFPTGSCSNITAKHGGRATT